MCSVQVILTCFLIPKLYMSRGTYIDITFANCVFCNELLKCSNTTTLICVDSTACFLSIVCDLLQPLGELERICQYIYSSPRLGYQANTLLLLLNAQSQWQESVQGNSVQVILHRLLINKVETVFVMCHLCLHKHSYLCQ